MLARARPQGRYGPDVDDADPLETLLRAGSWTGPSHPQTALPAGDVTVGVVRVADTVRRPRQPQSRAVAALLLHLHAAGFRGAPRFLGTDAEGRDVLEHVDGDVAGAELPDWAADDALLAPLGALLRGLHEAAGGFVAPPRPQWFRDQLPDPPEHAALLPPSTVVGHNDVTPQNVVVRDGVPLAVVDFDLSGPTTGLREVVNTCLHWAPLRDPVDREGAYARMDPFARCRLLADGYGLSGPERAAFVDTAVVSAVVGRHRMRRAALEYGGGWARMWQEGVGDVIARREVWLRGSRSRIEDALLAGHRRATT